MEVVVTDPSAIGAACAEVAVELDAIDVAASRFRPDSEVSLLANAGGQPTEVSALLAELVAAALTAADRSDGDVDPTVGAAVVALGYDDDIGELDPTAPVATDRRRPRGLDHGQARRSHAHGARRGAARPRAPRRRRSRRIAAPRRVAETTGSGVLVNLGGDIATAGPVPDGRLASPGL